MALYHSFTWFS